MEAAGLVLGALPILLHAVDNYHRCLQLVKDFHRFEATMLLLRNHIFVQQEQLRITLRTIGLENPTQKELETRLRSLYPDSYQRFLNIISHMEKLLAKLMDKLDVDPSGKQPTWMNESSERMKRELRRVRRSLGRRSRERLIEDLQYWNDSLKLCVEKSELPLGSEAPCAILEAIQARFNPRDCRSTRESAGHIYRAASRAWRCIDDTHSHHANLQLAWHTGSDGKSKPESLKIALSSIVSASSSSSTLAATGAPPGGYQGLPLETWHELSFEVSDAATIEATEVNTDEQRQRPEHLSGLFRWAERIRARGGEIGVTVPTSPACEIPSSSFDRPPKAAESHPTIPEIDCLCRFLQEANPSGRLRLAPDSGGCREEEGVGVLVQRGKQAANAKAIPLREVLAPPAPIYRPSMSSATQSDTLLVLSRKERFSIAAAACWAVLHLAESPWLEDNWKGCDGLQLFVENQAQHFPTIPWLFRRPSPGWPFHRPSQPQQPAGTPELDRPLAGLVRNRILFELGILLIELCLSKPFEQIKQEFAGGGGWGRLAPAPSSGDSLLDDFELANLQTQKVYLEAGDIYGYAVQRCLRCEFPGRDVTKSFEFEQFRRDFFCYVVAPVQATFAMQPASCSAL